MSAETPPKKLVNLFDFLTSSQIERAAKCATVEEIRDQVIAPAMAEINRRLGQENNAQYLAYAVQRVLDQARLAQARRTK